MIVYFIAFFCKIPKIGANVMPAQAGISLFLFDVNIDLQGDPCPPAIKQE
ncbi:MAG: hypothetical protein ONB13_07000 [candidate division KSB1 bacterium]|nr:hypothetical protein [candidate division KSB1 bacterium]MDZ7358963.1 hypothetical protein [candidate division KSB1 bacterium]MDZ7376351.1 hypothetical protein [candidate division KSB1 bacterium]MDZ7402325.1 hypothetical protein [candidate division KSB1 bacterium]